MPSTKIPVLRDKMFGGVNRSVPSHNIPEDSWYNQFNFRRLPSGLAQVSRKRSFLAVAQGEVPTNPIPEVQPPKVAYQKYEFSNVQSASVDLNVFVTTVYSISCWTPEGNFFRPVITILNSAGVQVGESTRPVSLDDWTDWFHVVTLELVPDVYTILAAAPENSGSFTLVITGGPELTVVSNDEGIEKSAIVYSSADAALYFITRQLGVEHLRKIDIFLGSVEDVTTSAESGYFTKHLFFSPTQGKVYASWTDGQNLKLQEVSTASLTIYTFPTYFEVAGGVYIPTTDKILFHDKELASCVLFDCTVKTFTPVFLGFTNSYGQFSWLNDQLFFVEPNNVRKVSHTTFAITASYAVSIDSLYYDAEGGKYYGFSKTMVGFRFNLSFGLESSFDSLLPICFSSGRRNFIGADFQEQLPTYSTLVEIEKPTGDVVELHQINKNLLPTFVNTTPLGVWVPEIGRFVVMTNTTAGMVFDFLP